MDALELSGAGSLWPRQCIFYITPTDFNILFFCCPSSEKCCNIETQKNEFFVLDWVLQDMCPVDNQTHPFIGVKAEESFTLYLCLTSGFVPDLCNAPPKAGCVSVFSIFCRVQKEF